MRSFLDNMISPKFAGALRALGRGVRALRQEFPPDTPDEDWLGELGRRGWVLVSQDKRIRTRPHQRAVLAEANVTAFFLGPFWSKKLFWDQAVWIIRHWPRFEAVAETMARGTCFAVQERKAKMTPLSPR